MAFIVFEGIDACGKSTQIQRLADLLNTRNIDFVLTREPGGTPLAEEIRHLLLRTDGEAPVPRCELLLYQAGRAQHVDTVIGPALKGKNWVISDRYFSSTLAFQAHGRNLKAKDIVWLNKYASAGLYPDLTILLDISVEESQKRLIERASKSGVAKDRFEKEETAFFKRVRASYLQQAKKDKKRWLVLDGKKSIEALAQEIVKILVKKKWLKN